MTAICLAATVHLAFPQAQRVAINGARLVAASASGRGIFIEGGKVVGAFEAGDNPMSIAFAGADVVIAHHERKYVTLHRAPSFAPMQIPVDVTPHTHFAAVGDLDGDGHPDIVVNDMGGRRVIVLWGPDFRTSAAILTGSKGYAYENVAVVGDRIYVPCWPQSEVAVLRAQGRVLRQERLIELSNPAFFVAPDASAVVTYSGSIADGTRDGLVLLASGKSLDAGRAPVRVASYGGLLAVAALGGTVKLFPEGRILELPGVQDVALGDLDGDGKPDFAVAAGDEIILFLSR